MYVKNRALSSINYFVLRAVTGKEEYSESVTNEISFFLEGLCKELEQDKGKKFSTCLYGELKNYIFQELDEGDYINSNIDDFCDKFNQYCLEKTELDMNKIPIVCGYYKSIAEEVIKERSEQER